jgi:hypothetical protein
MIFTYARGYIFVRFRGRLGRAHNDWQAASAAFAHRPPFVASAIIVVQGRPRGLDSRRLNGRLSLGDTTTPNPSTSPPPPRLICIRYCRSVLFICTCRVAWRLHRITSAGKSAASYLYTYINLYILIYFYIIYLSLFKIYIITEYNIYSSLIGSCHRI